MFCSEANQDRPDSGLVEDDYDDDDDEDDNNDDKNETIAESRDTFGDHVGEFFTQNNNNL